ncbi:MULTISPECIES: YjbF family lipoprotein [Pseudomonas]|uniref:YjbF family lipoprotein n=1 Tax=Pseudomonas helleri TaxID=1608996 RepID=A0A7X1WVV2_9PSED|nr:YjbF family lipoprotein [Pseudomonas helleri]MQT75621.1 YjbF family lipoprotein [Pseudomonas helleri]
MKILRNLALLALPVVLSGCSPLMSASIDTLKASFQGAKSIDLTQAQVDALPYAQIQVTTSSSEGVMALARQRGELEFWIASGKQTLLIRNGFVVRSIGLLGGTDGTRFDGESPFKRGLHQLPDDYTSTRWIDLYEGQRTGLPVHSRFVRKSLETVEILDKEYELLRVDERMEIPDLGYSATNRYWVDPSSGVIQVSVQHLSPDLALRVMRLPKTREVSR